MGMKRLLQIALPVVLMTGWLNFSALAQGRIAVVDMGKVFDGYWRTKQADAALKEQAADMEKEHKGFIEDWNKAKEEYQKLLASANDPAISTEERDRRKSAAEKKLLDIRELEGTIQQYERQARTTLDEKQRRMRANILSEIRAVINARAQSAGYVLVLDIAGLSLNNVPVVLYQNGENDITADILKQLNANAPPELPKAPEKKGDDKKPDSEKPAAK